MKQIWVKAVPWIKEVALAAVESGADALWVPPGKAPEVKKMGIIPTVAEDGDLILGRDVVEREVKGKADEEEIVELSQSKRVVVKGEDWTIIPLENLVSQARNIFVEIEKLQEATTALSILEKGVDGIVVTHKDPEVVRHIVTTLKRDSERLELFAARIRRVEPLGMGDRVCVDTCSSMNLGEGILVGNSSQALFLVHSESVENPFVNTRSFRVNAGPVHAYVRLPGGKTKYLSEMKAGDEVLIVDFQGRTYTAVVGEPKWKDGP
jgi:3-dehydroquinate synthase II